MERFFDTGYKKHLKQAEDFQVDEIIESKFLRKFQSIGGRVEKMKGNFALCLLSKKERTTEDVLRELREKLGFKVEIGFAGLKDKNAVTSQYITFKSPRKINFKFDGATITFLNWIDKQISRGDLIGNRFSINLHDFQSKKLERVKGGFPNFFGPQRFGAHQDNHIQGRKLLMREFHGIISKERAKFFVHAYQSFLFNKALEKFPGSKGEVKIPGFGTKLGFKGMEGAMRELMEKDEISEKSFRISELKLTCQGSSRKVWIIPKELEWGERLEFRLPRGSYATVLLQEIINSRQ